MYISHWIQRLWEDVYKFNSYCFQQKAKEPPRKQYFEVGNNNTWIEYYMKGQKKDSWEVRLVLLYKKQTWEQASQDLTHHDVLGECVSAEGAVIEHHLIEGLRRHGDHPAAVIPGVAVLRDDRLPQGDALLTSLGLLMGQQRARRGKKQEKEEKTENERNVYLKNSHWTGYMYF